MCMERGDETERCRFEKEKRAGREELSGCRKSKQGKEAKEEPHRDEGQNIKSKYTTRRMKGFYCITTGLKY